ncbi:MAG: bifunctional diaminohydroxyphosphoribosylaminopyrimidine deaminase/5-amino-6-(5-phosphoribosylamino)uracil reductase RibD [Candidatus Auribacterota bacterium]|nr:bifunctional diaminohydroxyphosphoribosylaminopyrimidine deaminase/5-amino-6-(5-phosphoribosylamino)uracil reductase RibD [Candidatus Auribacterota bacterium]
MHSDSYYMRKALSLAARGSLAVRPNPRVGAVLVKNDRIIASAYHSRYGGPHAEVKVLSRAKDSARGATLYVNLEPCSTTGKTPPCTDAIIRSGIKRVVIGCRDRHPLNRDRARRIFTRAGITVTTGVMKEEAEALNRDFFTWAEFNRPYTTLKLALSLDGKIADRRGRSRWISSEPSRRYVHFLRSRSDAVLVGLNTVIADNPRLTARMGYKNQNLKRVVLDSRCEIPVTSRLLRGPAAKNTILATTKNAPPEKLKEIIRTGAQVMTVPSRQGRVSLKLLFRKLAGEGIMRLLAEGGSEAAASLLEEGLVDELHLFVAPLIIGGRDAISAIGGKGVKSIKEAYRLREMRVERLGEDIHIYGTLKQKNVEEKRR